jgi:hypothetical protein
MGTTELMSRSIMQRQLSPTRPWIGSTSCCDRPCLWCIVCSLCAVRALCILSLRGGGDFVCAVDACGWERARTGR